MAFRGTYDHSLDAKNRLTVPAKFRADLAGDVVLARGFERCLTLWPKPAWDAFSAQAFAGIHPLSPEGRDLRRWIHGGAFDTELDSAGRVGVPRELMNYAGLTKDCKLVGVEDSLEIWDRDAYGRVEGGLDVAALTSRFGGAPS